MELTLMELTRRLLNQSDKSVATIANDLSDKKITFYWLRKFKSGEIADPSVNKVQILYEYLVGAPLFASLNVVRKVSQELLAETNIR